MLIPRKVLSCLAVLYVAAATGSTAQTFTNLFNFDGTDGSYPYRVTLVQGANGEFYGTTSAGGMNDNALCSDPAGGVGCGTVFEVTAEGTLKTLYNFCSQTNCSDGADPYGGLILGTNGNFFGTTERGGSSDDGTVFEITPAGKLTTLHSFDYTDGAYPFAALVQASNGDFYGTAAAGGTDSCIGSFAGCGTVFKMTPGGTLTTLHSFSGLDGWDPQAGLVQATNGNFYGATAYGGATYGGSGYCPFDYACGTVFEMTPAGTLTTLYSFCSQPDCNDGQSPLSGLIQAADGDFEGTTYGGGTEGVGTLFSITPGGTFTTSSLTVADGTNPSGDLLQATDGNIYEATYGGGDYGYGTIFRVDPAGTLTVLFNFDDTDGGGPEGGLFQATNGTLYGTTTFGGGNDSCTFGCGTVFSLSVALGPFLELVPTAGKVGAKVMILGNNLTGSTAVSFNGTAATFTVKTATEITTAVPSGATTGYVKVTTPSGTLTSNVKFRVLP